MAADFMSRALALAWTAPEPTSPNPTVGAVVVADGEIIGEGVTEPPPGRHAEIVAPARHPMVMLGLGDSVATPPDGVQADVLVVRTT